MTATSHYDEKYFAWQKRIGQFGAVANRSKFQPYIRPDDTVVDFGCGGGFLLAAISCGRRLGVEINPAARAEAVRNGVQAVPEIADLQDGIADVIISNSALEHVEYPLGVLRELRRKVRTGGRLVCSVPHETLASRYVSEDVNQHLHTWSPMTLGNLVTLAGFRVEHVDINRRMRPPAAESIHRVVGEHGFLAVASVYRWLRMAAWPLRPVDIHADVIAIARAA